jgi:hypothetical protein
MIVDAIEKIIISRCSSANPVLLFPKLEELGRFLDVRKEGRCWIPVAFGNLS